MNIYSMLSAFSISIMSNGSISARPSTDDVAHRPHVAVIGAGLAGLTCATYLVMNGVRVTLIEKEARMGGQCWTRYEDNGVSSLGTIAVLCCIVVPIEYNDGL